MCLSRIAKCPTGSCGDIREGGCAEEVRWFMHVLLITLQILYAWDKYSLIWDSILYNKTNL